MKSSKSTLVRMIILSTVALSSWYVHANSDTGNNKTASQVTKEATPSDSEMFIEFACKGILNRESKGTKGNAEKNPNIQGILGRCYFAGIGVARDDRQAKFWYEKSAQQGNPDAQYMMGVLHDLSDQSFPAEKRLINPDFQQAVDWYQKSAGQGSALAQYALGNLYNKGIGNRSPADAKLAIDWYRQAANQGYAPAKNALGSMYFFGRGVEKDASQALFWFQKAADQGDALGQYNLSVALRKLKKDNQQALFWLKKSAENGNRIAQYRLGEAYLSGAMVKQDHQLAFLWYQAAAQQGEAGAQYGLSLMYREGKGVLKDQTKEIYWLKEAEKNSSLFTQTELTDTKYQLTLANLYTTGAEGFFEPDPSLAFFWYQKAAEQRNNEAQYELALLYQEGKGVAQSKDKARYWLKKSAENGYDKAQKLLGKKKGNL